MYIGHGRLCVSVSVCHSPHSDTTSWTQMYVGRMVGGALWLCTIGWICNRCMGFVAKAT